MQTWNAWLLELRVPYSDSFFVVDMLKDDAVEIRSDRDRVLKMRMRKYSKEEAFDRISCLK